MEKILVLGPFSEAMQLALRQQIPSESFELVFVEDNPQDELLRDADYVILRTLEIDRDKVLKLRKAKMIQRWGTGYDTVDIQAAGERGIQVCVTAGMNTVPVAEMTLALILAVYRNLIPLTQGIMSGQWEREEYSKRSFTISGKTVGVYGMGSIGKRVASLCNAFGACVLYYDSVPLSALEEQQLKVQFVSQDDLWKKSDILTLHAPLTEETRNIITDKTILQMKRNAVVINTAREEMIDTEALARALRGGKLLGVGLDAIESHLAQNNPFDGIKNVVLSAHLGGNTADNIEGMAKRCSEQIVAVSEGIHLDAPHLVNSKFLA